MIGFCFFCSICWRNDVYDIKELLSDNSESSSITEEINNIFPNNITNQEEDDIKNDNVNQESDYIHDSLVDLSNCYILESNFDNVFYNDDVQIKQYGYISNFKSYCNII